MRRKIPRQVQEIYTTLKNAGFECYVVGGAVRNLVLGTPPKDWDLATDALPQEVIKLFRKVIPTGVPHGTVTVLHKGISCEVTTFRIDGIYTDLRRPDSVEYTSSLSEDLRRRDFSINAMALDIETGEIIDPHDGQEDCLRKIIRAIGRPEERFDEDGLRILRGIRFAGRLGFTIESDTLAAMIARADNLKTISAERIRMEIENILESEKPSESFAIMSDTGVLDLILPELAACRGVIQREMHSFDVFTHSILACDGIVVADPGLRLAALFHDIGKAPALRFTEDGEPRFFGHEAESARLTQGILLRLKFPNALIRRVTHLIAQHMFSYDCRWTDAAVRRFIIRVGKENLEDLFTLRLADSYGRTGVPPDPRSLDGLRRRITGVLSRDEALTLKSLKLSGEDIKNTLSLPPGPSIGQILNFLFESVVEDPSLNDREKLLRIAENFYKTRLKTG
ncbi:MAG: HD domain-containing protein [Spirochaetales bacterium]|nr:HD domain-containing protein [Spirochaetales bacterium]